MEQIIGYAIGNWEMILGILGFVFSIFNFIIMFLNNRKNFKITENFYMKYKFNNKWFYDFSLVISNNSNKPISITGLYLLNDKVKYSVSIDRELMSTKKEDGEKRIFYSADLPINLNGLESRKEIFRFKIPQEIKEEMFTIIILTNRGTVKKKVDYAEKKIEVEDYLEKLH